METRKHTLYIGLNDKDTKKQEIDTLEAVKIATNIICRIVDGCTIYNATGIYHHDDGQIVIENSLRIEIINAAAAAWIMKDYRQARKYQITLEQAKEAI